MTGFASSSGRAPLARVAGRWSGALASALAPASALALASALAPGVALANGRFPQAQQLVVNPSDENHIAAQVTFGFIQTRDHGGSWTWACEDAAGYGGVLDPPIALLGDGTLIAAEFDGLAVGSEQNCSYDFATAPAPASCAANLTDLNGRYVIDVSREAGDASRAIAVSSNGCGGDKFDTRLWSTSDAAKTWAAKGVPLPEDYLALTLDAAASDPNTIYLSGFEVISSSDYQGALARSTDGGATWELLPIMGSKNDSAPYIGAIDPNDPQTLYVRLASDQGKLLVSHDGGTTFTTVLTTMGKMLGFALSPDGAELVAGGEMDGVLHAKTSDMQFATVSPIHTRCLTWWNSKVYACASEALDGFTLGESVDAGATFTPIYHLACLDGPVGCPADSDVATKCAGPWTVTQATIQTDQCTTASSSSSTGAGGGGGDDTGTGCCAVAVGSSSAPRDAVPSMFALAFGALGAGVRIGRRGRR